MIIHLAHLSGGEWSLLAAVFLAGAVCGSLITRHLGRANASAQRTGAAGVRR